MPGPLSQSIGLRLIAVVLLVLANAFFVAAEFALVAARRTRIDALARRGDRKAKTVQTALQENPFSGQVFLFRGRRGDLIKVLWFDGDGLCLFAKRLERGRFIWPQATSGTVSLTPAQLSMLLEGIDWRRPVRTQAPQLAV